MDHNEDRFARDQDSKAMFRLITDFFLNELKLDFVSKEEIDHMIGVLLTNGFENEYDGVHGRAIYPVLSLISHSCQANLRHAVNPGQQVALQVRLAAYKLQMIFNQFQFNALYHHHHPQTFNIRFHPFKSIFKSFHICFQ